MKSAQCNCQFGLALVPVTYIKRDMVNHRDVTITIKYCQKCADAMHASGMAL